jgi:transcriptional regulator with XRE-family HTH domain
MKSLESASPRSVGARIGLLVHCKREALGASLTKFALETGLSRTFLSRLERGQFADVKVTALAKLTQRVPLTAAEFCAATGCDLSTDLPEIEAYLRARYPQWPETAVSQVADYCRYHEQRYGKKGGPPKGQNNRN